MEIWQSGAPLYTLTDDIPSLYTKEIVTNGIGHFQLTLPTKKNGDHIYNDIGLNDKVKIWLGYDSVGTGDPTFVGKISRITAPLSIGEGYSRMVSGLSQGEVLLKRLKKGMMWWNTAASLIVATLASDLGLGTSLIQSDSTGVNMEVVTKSYFDVLQFISDYWVNATTKVQKDFFVDVNNNLVWHSRPFRDSGVQSLVLGENIQSYMVYRDTNPIYNSIMVYGTFLDDVKHPSDGDSLTEQNTTETPQDDGWSADVVWETSSPLSPKVGSEYVKKTAGDVTEIDMSNTLASSIKCARKGYNKLHFWISFRKFATTTLDSFTLSVGSTSSNFFYKSWKISDLDPGQTGDWVEMDVTLGSDAGFSRYSKPDWNTITYIRFQLDCSPAATIGLLVDGMYFHYRAAKGEANDSTSQTTYGRHDIEVSDETLLSDSDCVKRAEALLLQRKDPFIEVDVTTFGNKDILVGDQLTLTLPAENLTSAPFDVVSVEHFFTEKFLTKTHLISSINTRIQAAKNMVDMLNQTEKKIRLLAHDEKTIS